MKNNHSQNPPYQAPLVRGYADSYLKLSKNRSIFFSENFTDEVAANLQALLLYYDNQNDEPINLYIHSDGGFVSSLNGIYDVIQMIHAPVKTILLGKCYSAGAILLSAGSPGERYALKNSSIMIHATSFTLASDNIASSKNYLEFFNETNDTLLKILAKHTKQPLDKIREDSSRDFYMTAPEAIKYGIIDHIL